MYLYKKIQCNCSLLIRFEFVENMFSILRERSPDWVNWYLFDPIFLPITVIILIRSQNPHEIDLVIGFS